MAICNLFKKLEKPTGNFMIFSQYTEDLTKSMTQPGYYRVIPSKFYALNINYNNKLDVLTRYNSDLNKALPMYLQAEFENGCAIYRDSDKAEEITNWTANIFWDKMFQLFGHDDKDFLAAFQYENKINLQSYDEYDGMGYNEIYCFIPNDAATQQFTVKRVEGPENLIKNDGPYLHGFDEHDEDNKFKPIDWSVAIPDWNNKEVSYKVTPGYEITAQESLERKNIVFNTIIILYDVELKSKETGEIITYIKDIPLGMYLTGTIRADGSVTNTQTKYCNNPDIYDSGTSYGLRISSRFISTPNSYSLHPENVSTDNTSYPLYCRLMSQMAETQAKMDEILNQLYLKDQKYNELYNIFKNSRTNVPYIKNVNGKNCWFVNGRNIGPVEAATDLIIQ